MSERDLGPQPLDGMLEMWGLRNHDLVEASPEQLTHKVVAKARKGRQLTLKSMMKVTRTFNIAIWNRLNEEQREAYFEYSHGHLFNYAKGHDENWIDPNVELAAEVKAAGAELS